MSVATQARPSRGAARREAPAPRRWRSPLLGLIILLSVVAPVGFYWYLSAGVQPLSADDASLPSVVRGPGGEAAGVRALEPGPGGQTFTAYEAPYLDAAWLELGFTLRNDGPFDVTVDELGVPSEGGAVWRVSASMTGTDVVDERAVPEHLLPFGPFTLRPGQARFVVVRYRFAGCSLTDPGDEVLISTQRVRFGIELAGVTVHRTEDLAMPFSVRVSGIDGCP